MATGWTVRDRIAVGTRFSAPVQNGPGAHPASCTMGTESFPGVKSGRGVRLTPLYVYASNPGGSELFCTCPDRPWGPPSLLYNGYRVFPGGKERPGCDADPSPLLLPWSRKGRTIPLLPIWTVGPIHSLSACTRVHFTLYHTLRNSSTHHREATI